MSFKSTFIRVYCLGKQMHPDLTLNHLKHRVKLFFKTWVNFSDIQRWFEISDNPLLTGALKRFPLISGAMYWPYINYTWTLKRKLATIDQHYRMLDNKAAIIAQATLEDVELARLEDEYPGLRLVLDKASWFLREGEIVLNLFINNQRFYSIAFTLGKNNGEPLIYIGAIQGSNAETALEIYRDITHALHGMRPRDFLMVALKLLCKEVGFNKIWAVSNECRQHNDPYFGNVLMEKASYDEVWLEHGGKRLDNGFYEIQATVRYKDMEEIPTRKRAVYRRRYQMLDQLATDIKASCARHAELHPLGIIAF